MAPEVTSPVPKSYHHQQNTAGKRPSIPKPRPPDKLQQAVDCVGRLRAEGTDHRARAEARLWVDLMRCVSPVRHFQVGAEVTTAGSLSPLVRWHRCAVGSWCPKCNRADNVLRFRKTDLARVRGAAGAFGPGSRFLVLELDYADPALAPTPKELARSLSQEGDRHHPVVTGGRWGAEVSETRVPGGCVPLTTTTGAEGLVGLPGTQPRRTRRGQVLLLVLGPGATFDQDRWRERTESLVTPDGVHLRPHFNLSPAWTDYLTTWSRLQFEHPPEVVAQSLLDLKRLRLRAHVALGELRGQPTPSHKEEKEPALELWFQSLAEGTTDRRSKDTLLLHVRERLVEQGYSPEERDVFLAALDRRLETEVYRAPAAADASSRIDDETPPVFPSGQGRKTPKPEDEMMTREQAEELIKLQRAQLREAQEQTELLRRQVEQGKDDPDSPRPRKPRVQ